MPPKGRNQPRPAMPSAASERLLFKRTALVMFCVVLLSCIAIWAVWAQHQNVENTRAELQESYQVQVQLQNVFSLIQDAETGQRGYILTGDPSFLVPYDQATPAIISSVGSLKTLLQRDAELLRQAEQLERLIEGKQVEMARTIDIRDNQGRYAASMAVQEGTGKIMMDNIRVAISSLRHAEETARMARRAVEEREFRQLVALFLTLIAVIVAVLIVSGTIVFKALRQRMASEAALKARERQARGLQRIAEAAGVGRTLHDALANTLAELMRLLKGRHGLALWRTSASEQAAVRQITQSLQRDGTIEHAEFATAAADSQLGWPDRYTNQEVWIETLAAHEDTPAYQRVHVPVADEAGPSALLVLTIDQDDAPDETVESFAAAAGAQLRHAADRQRIVNTLNDSLTRSQGIFNNAIDGILTIRRNGMIEDINPAALQMFGYADADASNIHISRLLADEFSSPGNSEASLHIHAGIGGVHESAGQRQDGTRFPIDLALYELALFNQTLLVATVRDATERKRLDQIKNEFIATVSHELRTPLTSISGALQLLEAGAGGGLPEKAMHLAKIAHSNSNRLVRLVNDILDIQKIEAGLIHFDLRPQPLDAIAHLAIEANQGFAERYGVTLEAQLHSTNLIVLVDADRLNQVLTNLISNAVKFSPEGGVVTLAVQKRDSVAQLAVSDHGPGIPAEFQERIYHKFAQADASDQRRKGGTGLGLSITRQLVTQMNGRISFTTGPSGTVFTVEIPLAPQTPDSTSCSQS
ncbi:CHASE3 domain-containing protein [Bordetella petrii]|uniref:sensor histidine kinase n=1 Tax=Bordetella petrii TaxID=94624 RepID=UPI001A95B716|nr:CHASE3 domain-containing protein [Bordetella petrii]MBO1114241.1 CHASE3 domain-containing protein [Bordetella petrii]